LYLYLISPKKSKNSLPDTEMIITDELPAYRGIKDHDTDHQTVNHRLKEWARGHIHTNSIENVWSFLNRSLIGAYHKVSAKHLDAYLDELDGGLIIVKIHIYSVTPL